MSPLFALVSKDLRLFLQDRRALMISLVVPLVLAALMGFVFGGSGEASDIPVAVVDLDHSAVSQDIVTALGKEKAISLSPLDEADARQRVRKGKISVAVVIPKGFGDAAGRAFFGGGDKPTLLVLFDPSHSAERAMVEGILTEHVMQVVSSKVFSGQSGTDFVQQSLDQLKTSNLPADQRASLSHLLVAVKDWQSQQAKSPDTSSGAKGGLQLPYDTQEQPVTSGETHYNGYAHSFAGMGVQFVLFLGIEAAVAILTERQRGLWRRFRAAPLPRSLLLLSRGISGALIASAVFAVLMLAGVLFFGVKIAGSVLGLALVLLAFGLLCSTFGLLVAAIGKTPQAARGVAIFAVLVLVMLGGAWFPAFLFPPLLQKITLVTPTRWAVDALDAMTWRGLGLSAALPAVGVLVGYALVFGLIAAVRFPWDADA